MILVSSVVTASVMRDFLKARLIQTRDFGKAIKGYSEIIVSDHLWGAPSLGINRSQVIKSDLWVGGEIQISKAHNISIRKALEMGAEWLVLLDADGVLISPISVWPSTGRGNIKVRFQVQGETVGHSSGLFNQPVVEDYGWLSSHGITPAWFVLHRDVFSKYRFDESYVGAGFQDFDYSKRLEDVGIYQGACDACAVHLWHPIRNQSRATINERIFYR